MSTRFIKFIPRLPDQIRKHTDPVTALAADVLHALGIAVILWCLLYYAVFLPFFVARRVIGGLLVTALLIGSCVSLRLLYRAARDPAVLASPERFRSRVRGASWVLVGCIWVVVTILVIMDGGIGGRFLLAYVALVVVAGALLGKRVALLGTCLFFGLTLVLAILGQAGISLPRTLPGPPLVAWYVVVLVSSLAAVPLLLAYAAFGEALALARRRASELEGLDRALRESEARLRTIVETAPDAIFILNTSGYAVEVNEAALRDLGYTRAEMIGMHVTDIVAPAFRARATSRFPEMSGPTYYESIHMRKDGTEVPVELNTRKIVFQGEPALLGIARDITERKLTEERLRALHGQLLTAQEQERRRIARDLHDDITQRLAGLAIEIGLLRRHQLPAMTAAHVATLQEQAQQVATDLRDIAHEIHPGILEYVSLGGALDTLCAQVSRQREIAIDCVAEAVPDGIPRDISVTLYRIAQEAVGNAARHAEASSIHVTLTGLAGSTAVERLRLTVVDDGKGFQIENVRGGSGLGLLSIEERVHALKGRFALTSAPGEGTRLEVEVPLV